jgi:hypothetical protein
VGHWVVLPAQLCQILQERDVIWMHNNNNNNNNSNIIINQNQSQNQTK